MPSVEQPCGRALASRTRAPQRLPGRLRDTLRRAMAACRFAADAEMLTAAAVLGVTLIVGLATASDYGISIDEFNADGYGPKALAWLSFCFCRRQRSRSN